MTITLTELPENVQRYIQDKLAEGEFHSAEELVTSILAREVEKASRSPETAGKDVDADRQRINEINKKLYEDGVLSEYKPLPNPQEKREFIPVPFDGPPISQTIIEERR